jgi:hypothetical protein
MAKNDLLKEAIADAKAVRETALANAKIALEEAFTPRIQSMLSAKLSEEEGMEDEATMEAEDMETPEEPVAAEGRGSMNDADEDPTDMHSEEMAPEEEPVSEEGRGEEMDEAEGEDLELEAIIKELEDDMAVEEDLDSSEIGGGDNKVDLDASSTDDPGEGDLTEDGHADEEPVSEEGRGDKDVDEDVSLDEIINALREEEEAAEEPVSEEGRGDKDVDEAEAELEEAYKVIKFLKGKINEVNLLNAKLLFSNKLFRNHSLNEGQKMKVIENFDRAQSLREVKLVFATLSESFNLGGRTKRSIKESYASKPSRSTAPSKKVISEGNDLAARWKKLANL